MTADDVFRPGTQCVSVREVPGHAGYRYFRAAVYTVRAHKRTGRLTWRYTDEAGPERRSRALAERDAEMSSVAPYLPGIRHGSSV